MQIPLPLKPITSTMAKVILINILLLRHSLDTAKISNKPTKQKPKLMTTTSNTKLHEILFTVLS